MNHGAGMQLILHLLPEMNGKEIDVDFFKDRLNIIGDVKKFSESLRENIILVYGEPGFIGHHFVIGSRFGHFPETAIGEQRQFVIIIKYNPSPAGNPEIFKEEVARKNVAGPGRILNHPGI